MHMKMWMHAVEIHMWRTVQDVLCLPLLQSYCLDTETLTFFFLARLTGDLLLFVSNAGVAGMCSHGPLFMWVLGFELMSK